MLAISCFSIVSSNLLACCRDYSATSIGTLNMTNIKAHCESLSGPAQNHSSEAVNLSLGTRSFPEAGKCPIDVKFR